MKIRGNTVGTPIPRSDWSQDNPQRADYIHNRPDIDGKIRAIIDDTTAAEDKTWSSKLLNSVFDNNFHSSRKYTDTKVSAIIDDTTSAEDKTWSSKKIGTQLFDCYDYAANQAKEVINDVAVTDKAWSSQNTVDKLCPSFTESDYVAVCEPLEGYPLNVVSTISADYDGTNLEKITLTQCGKNLFDFKQTATELTYTNDKGGQATRFGHAIYLPSGTYTIKATSSGDGKRTVTLVINGADASNKALVYLVANTATYKQTFTLTDGDVVYVLNANSGSTVGGTTSILSSLDLQLEAGSVATDYEPYCGKTYTANFTNAEQIEGKGFYNWNTGLFNNGASDYQHDIETGRLTMIDSNPENTIIRNIPAVSGTNRFYSDCGNTTVSGRADPVTIIEKLTNAILALGGNV